ncbi:MAG TPA: TlpA family protein disulfide reductase [Gammaproteobacteria bacterium]|nr:TlpA family protein disulfide reductase [Gammaproteobacteria bacterium]
MTPLRVLLRAGLLCWGITGLGTSLAGELAVPKGVMPVAPRAAPALVLQDMDGARFDLARQRGRWVFVHFWASWCGPCRREIPAIQRLAQKLKTAKQAPVLAIINTAEDEDTVFTFLGVLAPDLMPLMDSDGEVTEAWQPRGLPSTYLVDPRGMIRYQALGGRPWDEDDYFQFLIGLDETL